MTSPAARSSRYTKVLLQAFKTKDSANDLRSRLIRGAMGSFSLTVVFAGLTFITSIVLARLLGTKEYGAYAYAMTWVNFLVIPALLGLDFLIVRQIAVYEVEESWGLMNGMLRWSNRTVLLVAVILALLAALGGWLLMPHSAFPAIVTFWTALLLVPLISLSRIRQSALRGLHATTLGQVPETLIQPGLLIVLIIGAYLWAGHAVTAAWVAAMNVGAATVALWAGARFLRRCLPPSVHSSPPTYDTAVWMRAALPLLCMNSMSIASYYVDTLALGMIKGTEVVGIYAVALQGASIIGLTLGAASRALSPAIASLYASRDMEQLQRVVVRGARAAFLTCLPVAIALIVFGHWFLLLFGPKFTEGRTALAILSLGQLFNTAMGSAGILLVMTGHGRDAALGVGLGGITSVVLNVLLIPRWGIAGAAMASAASTVVWNVSHTFLAYHRLGIHPSIFGRTNHKNPKWSKM